MVKEDNKSFSIYVCADCGCRDHAKIDIDHSVPNKHIQGSVCCFDCLMRRRFPQKYSKKIESTIPAPPDLPNNISNDHDATIQDTEEPIHNVDDEDEWDWGFTG